MTVLMMKVKLNFISLCGILVRGFCGEMIFVAAVTFNYMCLCDVSVTFLVTVVRLKISASVCL